MSRYLLALVLLHSVAFSAERVLDISDGLSLVVWNVSKGSWDGWQTQLKKLGARSDVILLQEATSDRQFARFMEPEFFVSYAEGYSVAGYSGGVMSLSRAYPELEVPLRSSVRELYATTEKSMLVTEYVLSNGKALLVVNVHAVNYRLGLNGYRKQLELLRPYLSAHIGPIVFAGDFNTWGNGRMQALVGFTSDFGLQEVEFERHDGGVFGLAFDHVFVRGLELQEAEHLRGSSSDHNAIFVHFK